MLLGTRTLHIKQCLDISSAIAASQPLTLLEVLTLTFYFLTRGAEKSRVRGYG